jgi:hypothetical protein
VLAILGGSDFKVQETWAVYNPSLVQAFCLNKEKLENRAQSDPKLFFSEAWRNGKNRKTLSLREWTFENLTSMLNLFSFNKIESVSGKTRQGKGRGAENGLFSHYLDPYSAGPPWYRSRCCLVRQFTTWRMRDEEGRNRKFY